MRFYRSRPTDDSRATCPTRAGQLCNDWLGEGSVQREPEPNLMGLTKTLSSVPVSRCRRLYILRERDQLQGSARR